MEAVSQAVQVLADAKYVFLDCEGRNLGCEGGALSLISLGTPNATEVYLFDALALPRNALQLLFSSILSLTPSARAKTKVVWDGRMDYVELLYSYACPIENVLDLQLVDVLSRIRRGHTENQRLYRFARKAFPMPEVRKLQLEEVHVLNGMDGAIREHRINSIERKNESIKRLHADNLTEIWMRRPLSNELLAYAASDITRIAGLYDYFLQKGYLEPLDHHLELSGRYVSMHHEEGKPDPENIFLTGPYLPLSIPLSLTPQKGNIVIEQEKECSGCRRSITERHFPFECDGGKKGREATDNRKGRSRSDWCKICTLILAKAKYAEERKVQRETTMPQFLGYLSRASK